jgi:hypothetical protein
MASRRQTVLWPDRWHARSSGFAGSVDGVIGVPNVTASPVATASAPRARRVTWMTLAVLACAIPASAITVGGGGAPRVDCLAVFEVAANTPVARPKGIRCTDGDPTCDADGVVNGVCEFPIAVCANSDFSPMCTLQGVQTITIAHALDDGDP